jgi:hypothetical protein
LVANETNQKSLGAVAETPATFAALYVSNDPGVSAPGKPWIKLDFGRPAKHSLASRINLKTGRPEATLDSKIGWS